MLDSHFTRLIAVLGSLVLFSPFFIAGCGDEGEEQFMDITGPAPTDPPLVTPPPDAPIDPPADEPPVNPPVEPPPDEPPVVDPPDEPPVDPPDPPPPPEPQVSFQDDLLIVLNASCNFPGCHGANPPSGLMMTTFANFQKGGNSGQPFVANDSNDSLIIKRLTGAIQPQMPRGGAPLNNDQIQLFRDWIDEGALDN